MPDKREKTSFNGNYFVGTQAIYAPGWEAYRVAPYAGHTYSEPGYDMLSEFRECVAATGLNHFKFKMSTNNCASYKISSSKDSELQSLTELALVAEVEATLADPRFKWYHIWTYSFSLPRKLSEPFTSDQLEAERQEIYDLTKHLLTTYKNTGKVFFLGNWEGDWELMCASGCQNHGAIDMDKTPSQEIIDKYTKWTKTRQQAIDQAKADVGTDGVNVFFYIEFNMGLENFDKIKGALRPTMLNSVVPKVNPDFLSYSSYKSTNKYMDHQGKWFDQAAVDEKYWKVLNHAQSKLSKTKTFQNRHRRWRLAVAVFVEGGMGMRK